MNQIEERIRHLFTVSIETKIGLVDLMSPTIAKAGLRLAQCLLNNGKIFICGNGGCAANCLHFSTTMLNHYEVERPPLPVIALTTDTGVLTAIADEGHYEHYFARQIQALGHQQDVLIALTTTGNATSVLQAVDAANDHGMDTIALCGRDGGVLANHMGPEDIEIRVPGETAAHIRQLHLFILYCFCDVIEQTLFGQMLG